MRVALLALLAMAGTAQAQLVPADSLPPFERPNGALLRPGVLTYAISLIKPDGQSVALGSRTVTVSDATLGGTNGWLIADARRGTAVETNDSVYVMRADMTPERWTANVGKSQLGVSFARDSMFGGVDTYRGRSSFALAVPRGALLSAGMTERIVELLPLRTAYRAGASLVLLGPDLPRVVPAEISVDREERINVDGRSVDCWLVVLRAGAMEERLWIAKSGSRVVRTEQAVADGVLRSDLLLR